MTNMDSTRFRVNFNPHSWYRDPRRAFAARLIALSIWRCGGDVHEWPPACTGLPTPTSGGPRP
jgi:hypothetical protein